MSSNEAAMETALLEIAKDLLQASDDLASTDPSASAKLAHEAYEIGRDLGIVRNHLDVDDPDELAKALEAPARGGNGRVAPNGADRHIPGSIEQKSSVERQDVDDDTDPELLRILDRQKALLPGPIEVAPVRKPSRNSRPLNFESPPPRRSSWFGWMRSREWRHAG